MAEESTAEDQFRSSLKDMILVVKKLAPICRDLDEVAAIIDLALTNDGQLTLLVNQVGPVQLKK